MAFQKDVNDMSHSELVTEAGEIGVEGRPGFKAKNKARLGDWDDKDLRDFIQLYRDMQK